MDESTNSNNLIIDTFTDFESNSAMASRHFDPTDFASIAALTVEQLLTAIVESDTAFILGRLCEKLESLRAEQVKALVSRL